MDQLHAISARLELIRPVNKLKRELLAYMQEFAATGDDRYKKYIENIGTYFKLAANLDSGRNIPLGYVRMSTFWLIAGSRIVGTCRVRHKISTPRLSHEGGHIGYEIRPAERGKGYGTVICARSLVEASRIGLGRVLITCDRANTASARIIEKNGGIFESEVPAKYEPGEFIRRYWVDLTSRNSDQTD